MSKGAIWLRLIVVVSFCAVAEVSGALLFVGERLTTWWPTLNHPAWAPPLWAWGIIGVAYNMMAVLLLFRSWGVLAAGGSVLPLAGSVALVVANQLWSGAFFGLESALAGLLALIPYTALTAWLMVVLRKHDPTSAWLLAPYCLWLVYDFVWLAAVAGSS